MKKLIVIAPLFFSTLFFTSYVNVSLIELNNNYRTSNLLISYGGGGGGGGGGNQSQGKSKTFI